MEPTSIYDTVASLRHRISHRKFELFDLNITIGYESASRGPLLGVENCDLLGNSIVPSSKSVPPRRGHDRVTLQIEVFEKIREPGDEASGDHHWSELVD